MMQTTPKKAVIFLIGACAAFSIASTATLAAPQPYEFDKTHTHIAASWDHRGYSRQHIEFTNYDGVLQLDFENPAASTVEVTIDLANMGYWVGAPENDRFEKHLASSDLFDIEAFPTATFKATQFETENGEDGVMSGELTMKGQTHPITLDVHLNKRGTSRGRNLAGFSAKGVVDRTLWGLGFGVPDIPAEITISIEAELVGPPVE